MSKENAKKAVVGRWFADFWGEKCNLGIVDEPAAMRSSTRLAGSYKTARLR